MGKKTKILLVDDDADIRIATTRVLKSAGYRIREASSVKEGMEKLRADFPDLLLLDVVLPDGDGRQLCSQIKADPGLRGIFVVLLSGIKTSSNDQVEGLDLGADGFIARPVSNKELLARIQAMDRIRLAEKALQEAHDALEIRVIERTAELGKVNEQLQIEINKRKQKESILRETLERLNEAERVGNFGYRVQDLKTGEEWWSENEYAIHGLPQNVKPSYDLHMECVHPDDRTIHDREFKEGWESDSEWNSFEYRIVRKDGKVRNILACYRFERDSRGNPLRASGTDQDITDQKLSKKILAQSKDFNRAILLSMKDHIVVLDKAGQILSANSSWFEFARKNDVSSLKLVGEGVNYLEVCRRASEDSDETVQQALSGIKAVLDGSQEHFELEYPCHSQSMQRWFLMNVIPFKGEKGGVVIAHTDISFRKKADEELRRAELNYRTVADFTYDWEYWQSPDGNFNYVSPSSERITGYRAEEFIENPALLEQIIVLEDRNIWFDHRQQVIEGPKRREVQFRIHRKDGEIRWIEHVCRPVSDEQGNYAGVRASNRDITRLRLAEQEARENREDLELLYRTVTLDQLAGSIAHELTQPLTGIMSNAQAAEILLKRGDGNRTEMEEILSDIIADSKRSGDILQNLRDLFSRQQTEFKPMGVNELVRETIRLLNSEFVIQGLNIHLDLSHTLPDVMGNKIQLQQVMINLINNAKQAMQHLPKADRSISFITARGNQIEVQVCVEDTGPGIDPERLEDIFEPLTISKPGRLGMGLSISRSIVQAHGGRIWAENITAGGARISFTLPAVERKS